MTRRSAFVDKLSEYASLAFADGGTRMHCGRWRAYFEARRAASMARPHSPPQAGDVEGQEEGTRMKDEALSSSLLSPPLLLEIGCYNAGFLTQIAAQHPAVNFIGLDWKARPLYLGAQNIAAQGLANLSLLWARAQDLTSVFADGELDEIWLFHPDPFDDERERGMRLMSEAFLLDAGRLLRPRGRLVLKTDHAEYFESTRSLISRFAARFAVEHVSADFWQDERVQRETAQRLFAGQSTFFEGRFRRRRVPIGYLSLIRV